LNHFSIELSNKEELATLIEQFSRRNIVAIGDDLSDRSVFVQDLDGIQRQVEDK
jgi:catechol-2,3-dioxygenase